LYQKQQMKKTFGRSQTSRSTTTKAPKASWWFRWWIGESVSASFGAKERSFADRAEARRVYRGADDCGAAGADSGSAENAVNLIQFFEACPSRHAMIVAFLAVLEMVKLQAVALVQEKQFGIF